ncbi:MAG TPA: isoprenylcysteine carboxylmethyltransferase family protein [Terriglobales bacterium]|jgi:protein-S-isoprenylcysteine O-methyltransferase Ste14|nr:isoprenylcysteine carboxylmethyltransferase family protein [Terriglobales bacterium]
MPLYAFVILLAGWIIWATPFFLIRRQRITAAKIDRRARWGIVLQVIAYALVWQGHFWIRVPTPWRVTLNIIFAAMAATLSWTGTRALGRQWRIDAGLNADHELIQSGPYRLVRHPIYTSMLCVLLATGFMTASWPLLLVSFAIFMAGLEIRTRVEDGLLSAHFGDAFETYRRSVAAYIPFVR